MRRHVENLVDSYRLQENADLSEQSNQLAGDIIAMIDHCYGDRSQCHPENIEDCNKYKENLVIPLKKVRVYERLEHYVARLASHARCLILKRTSNTAERFHSIGNAMHGGRRINESSRNGFELRNSMAVIQFNSQRLLSKLHGDRYEVPIEITEMESAREAQLLRNSIWRAQNPRKRRGIIDSNNPDYGQSCQQPDVQPDIYERYKKKHEKLLQDYQTNRERIFLETRDQDINGNWGMYRKKLLTASLFKEVCTMRDSTSCAALVKKILHPQYLRSEGIEFGKTFEATARAQLEVILNKKIELSGLVIDTVDIYLGASPDGLIDDDGIVEIKCLSKGRNYTPEVAIQKFALYQKIFEKGSSETLNKKHQYWYQIQGQLHVTRDYCVLALFTELGLKHVTVPRDDHFWENHMIDKLKSFYTDCRLPEILDSRHNRNMPIRNPPYREAAMKEFRQRSEAKRRKTGEASEIRIETDVDPNPRDTCDSHGTSIANKPLDWVPVEQDDDNRPVEEHERMVIDCVNENICEAQVIDDIRPMSGDLKSDSIQLFLQILEQNSKYRTLPVLYCAYQHFIEPSTEELELNIIGGNESRHWCCVHYDGTSILVYDSNRTEYEKLAPSEKKFLKKRYPNISTDDISFQPVTRQPDHTSCGVYAAAFATSVALGENPAYVQYSKNAIMMRQHLIRIIREKKLISFPNDVYVV